MLQALRKSVASIFIKILFGLLVVSFAIWGVGDFVTGGFFDDPAVKVGEVEVSATELDVRYRNRLNNLRRRFNINEEQARQFGIPEQVLQAQIARAAFRAEALALGLTASSATIASNIRSDPAFASTLGVFDRAQFEQTLAANGLNEEAYTTRLRYDISRNQLLDALAGVIPPPKAFADTLHRWEREQREASYVKIPVDQKLAVADPGDSTLGKFLEENSGQFQVPELRTVSFIHLTPERFIDLDAISESALRKAYDERLNDYTVPGKRTVLQLLADTEEKARQAIEELADRKFDDVAREFLNQSGDSVTLGEITREDLPAELADAVFTLKKDVISEPIKGPLSWHVFKVTALTPGKTASFEEVSQALRRDLAQEAAVDEVFRLSSELEDLLGGGQTLEEAASALTVKIVKKTTSHFGRDADGKSVDDLPGAPFFDIVFEATPGEVSDMVETEQETYFAARLERAIPETLPTLTSIRGRVVEAWKAEQRVNKTRKRAEGWREKLEHGENLADLAKQNDLTVQTDKPVFRDGPPNRDGLPQPAITALFDLPTTGKTATVQAGDTFYLLRLDRIIEADATKDFDSFRTIADRLRNGMSADLTSGFGDKLQEKHGVYVNRRITERVFNPDAGYSGR